MQLLADVGHEYGSHKGLGWIKGEVKKIETAPELPIPHIGWNGLEFKKTHPLTKDMGKEVYFVHSYCFAPKNPEDVIATTSYGTEIIAVLARDNIMGVQFHPEKSQQAGLALLRNFLTI
jgi:glutamine amidotransferase